MLSSRSRILALRVVNQMLADRRTLALMCVVPVILLSFLGILIRAEPGTLEIGVVNEDEGFTLAGNTVNLGERLINVLGGFGEFKTETLKAMLERVAPQTANTLVLAGSPAAVSSPTPATDFTTTIDAAYLYGGPEYDTLDYMAPALIGFFVFFFVFLLTCISFLRERVAGTLERLQATPIRAHEIIIGYMLGFLVFGLLQGVITLLFTVFVLNIHYAGNLLNIFIVEGLLVMLSVNLGILLSTFAQNEFQVLQFIPLIVVSQGLLGGVIWQIEAMPGWLQPFSRLMPLTYATEALRNVMIKGESLRSVADLLLVLVAFAAGVIVLAARTAGRAKI
jgi:ABC-2 type transport system permease protein